MTNDTKTKIEIKTQQFLEHVIDKIFILVFLTVFLIIVSIQSLLNEINISYRNCLKSFLNNPQIKTISEIELEQNANKFKTCNLQFHLIGNVKSSTTLVDSLTGIQIHSAIKLKRVIEQFVEEKCQPLTPSTPNKRQWAQHQNIFNTSNPYIYPQSDTFFADKLSIGNQPIHYNIHGILNTYKPYDISQQDLGNSSDEFKQYLNANNLYTLQDSSFNCIIIRSKHHSVKMNDMYMYTPYVGDIRISQDYVESRIVSLVSKFHDQNDVSSEPNLITSSKSEFNTDIANKSQSNNSISYKSMNSTCQSLNKDKDNSDMQIVVEQKIKPSIINKILYIQGFGEINSFISENRVSKNEIVSEYTERDLLQRETLIQRLTQSLIETLSVQFMIVFTEDVARVCNEHLADWIQKQENLFLKVLLFNQFKNQTIYVILNWKQLKYVWITVLPITMILVLKQI